MNTLIYLISFLILFLISIPLHEFGHLVCGLLSGYKFLSFRIGPFVWTKLDGKINFAFSRLSFAAGQCLMSPPEKEEDFKFILYNLGGGLFNFFLGAIFLVMFIISSDEQVVYSIAFGGIVSSFSMAFFNLVPIKQGGVPNDGYNVYCALKSKEAKHGFFVMLKTNEETVQGKRYRDYSSQAFEVDDQADLKNIFIVNLLTLQAARLYDLGKYDESIAVYDKVDLNALPLFYRNSIYLDFLYYYIIHNPSSEKARDLHSKKKMASFLKMGIPTCTRVDAAYEFFINGDKEKGEALLESAKKQLSSFPNDGVVAMEGEYIADLENRMKNL